MGTTRIKSLLNITLSKFRNKRIEDVIDQVIIDLNGALNDYLSENETYVNDFPVEIVNEIGAWKIHANGNVDVIVSPRTGIKHIIIDMEILPTNTKDHE